LSCFTYICICKQTAHSATLQKHTATKKRNKYVITHLARTPVTVVTTSTPEARRAAVALILSIDTYMYTNDCIMLIIMYMPIKTCWHVRVTYTQKIWFDVSITCFCVNTYMLSSMYTWMHDLHECIHDIHYLRDDDSSSVSDSLFVTILYVRGEFLNSVRQHCEKWRENVHNKQIEGKERKNQQIRIRTHVSF